MIRAYSEIVQIDVPLQIKEHVADLIRREKTTGLTTEETAELDSFLKLELEMRMAKAR